MNAQSESKVSHNENNDSLHDSTPKQTLPSGESGALSEADFESIGESIIMKAVDVVSRFSALPKEKQQGIRLDQKFITGKMVPPEISRKDLTCAALIENNSKSFFRGEVDLSTDAIIESNREIDGILGNIHDACALLSVCESGSGNAPDTQAQMLVQSVVDAFVSEYQPLEEEIPFEKRVRPVNRTIRDIIYGIMLLKDKDELQLSSIDIQNCYERLSSFWRIKELAIAIHEHFNNQVS